MLLLWVLGIVAVYVIGSAILNFLGNFLGLYWPWLVGGAIAIAVVCGVIASISSESERKKAELQTLRDAEAEAQRQQELVVSARAAMSDFKNYLTPCLIIDSNIWMNEEYDGFFHLLSVSCRVKGYKLSLFGPQFDEISNIKKITKFGDDRNKRARLAINRVEDFQKRGWLKIEPVTTDAQRGAYADPLLVKLITKKAREGVESTFISDDKELRIRIRQHLEDFSEADWQIVEIRSILPACRDFSEAWCLGLLKSSAPGQV